MSYFDVLFKTLFLKVGVSVRDVLKRSRAYTNVREFLNFLYLRGYPFNTMGSVVKL